MSDSLSVQWMIVEGDVIYYPCCYGYLDKKLNLSIKDST